MYCFKCGKQIAADSIFCEFCGARVKSLPMPVLPHHAPKEKQNYQRKPALKTRRHFSGLRWTGILLLIIAGTLLLRAVGVMINSYAMLWICSVFYTLLALAAAASAISVFTGKLPQGKMLLCFALGLTADALLEFFLSYSIPLLLYLGAVIGIFFTDAQSSHVAVGMICAFCFALNLFMIVFFLGDAYFWAGGTVLVSTLISMAGNALLSAILFKDDAKQRKTAAV